MLRKNKFDSEKPLFLRCPETTKRAWDFYKSADAIYQRRVNYFLVAESMLLFSFVTLFELELKEIQILITYLGLIITFSWFYINARIAARADKLKGKYLVHNDPVYWEYIKSVKSIREGFFSSYILPNSILFLWSYLLMFLLKVNGQIIVKCVFAIAICLGSSMIIKGLTCKQI